MEPLKLKRLLKDIPVQLIKGSKEIEITGISSNSKSIAPGFLFIAKKGITHDGARFIPDAIEAGAVAIVTDLYDPFYPQITQIIHSDVGAIEAAVAKEYYQRANEKLFLIGLTGTNGKTTTTYLIHHLLEQLKEPCGLIGSIEAVVGQHVFPSMQNTRDVLTNFKLFHEMTLVGCKSCVMEVSSHGLDQGRVRSIPFDIAIFTNLTHDHLDYHETMEKYAEAKAKLFSSLAPTAHAIINAESAYAEHMIAHCKANIIRFGTNASCDVWADEIVLSEQGVKFTLHYQGQSHPIVSSLIGRFNVYNLLAALTSCLVRGYPLPALAKALQSFTSVPGRLERVPNDKHLNIFVDYAHKPDALRNVLETLNGFNRGKIITVFGCGGNRDRSKRPHMGAIAEKLSHTAIVTNDNPRQEDPNAIIREILAGWKDPASALVVPDRREAIHRAIHMATPEDIVLIAGKGHETYQIFSDVTIDFDDAQVAIEACLGKK